MEEVCNRSRTEVERGQEAVKHNWPVDVEPNYYAKTVLYHLLKNKKADAGHRS
jgi:hypothetical protein